MSRATCWKPRSHSAPGARRFISTWRIVHSTAAGRRRRIFHRRGRFLDTIPGRSDRFQKGQYQLAAERESAAIRQRPHWIEVHRSLAHAYSALGRHREADAELAVIARGQQDAATDSPPYLRSLYQGSLLTGKPLR